MAFRDSLNSFLRDLKRFSEGTVAEDTLKLQRVLFIEILTRVVKRTPVKTGHARRNWQGSAGAPVTAELPGVDPTGASAIQTALSFLATIRAFDVVYITNNVNYILFLENGTPHMAPRMMIALTLEEIRSIFR